MCSSSWRTCFSKVHLIKIYTFNNERVKIAAFLTPLLPKLWYFIIGSFLTPCICAFIRPWAREAVKTALASFNQDFYMWMNRKRIFCLALKSYNNYIAIISCMIACIIWLHSDHIQCEHVGPEASSIWKRTFHGTVSVGRKAGLDNMSIDYD